MIFVTISRVSNNIWLFGHLDCHLLPSKERGLVYLGQGSRAQGGGVEGGEQFGGVLAKLFGYHVVDVFEGHLGG